MLHPAGINLNLILNADAGASAQNVLMDVPEKRPGFTHIALEVNDAAAIQTRLAELGITITETVKFEGAEFCFVRDPDGNVLEFHKPA